MIASVWTRRKISPFGCSAYGCAEHDRNDVAGVRSVRYRKSSGNTGLTEQVTEHQHTKKWCYGRKKQGAEQNNEYREYNLLDFGFRLFLTAS